MRPLIITLGLLLATFSGQAKVYELYSPDKQICVSIYAEQDLSWAVSYAGEALLNSSPIALELISHKTFGEALGKAKVSRREVDQILTATVPLKSSKVKDHFCELKLSYPGWAVVFRAYDNGVAYRFETRLGARTVYVEQEHAQYNFAEDCSVYWAEEKNPHFISHCEADFKDIKLSEAGNYDKSFLPLSLLSPKGTRMVLTESDLYDYPCMFVRSSSGTGITATFPPSILESELHTDRDINVLEYADFIAATSGNRSYPWRVLTIGDDRSLLENNLVWQLASEQVPGDASWIKPGKVSWEWWAMLNLYGVDFKAGVNTQTYKYYADFAAHYGIEYILLDEGWSASTMDITHPKAELDLQELITYAKSKGVGVVLWTLWTPMMEDMKGILDTYQKWGVSGIKIDFMQRNDQEMVCFYEDVARECFKRKLLVDFHGSFKPTGLQRKYPNIMSYEGVYGMEHDKCSYDIDPEHDLTLPFTRMVAGPMDYTPGATINATKEDFAIRWSHPMSQGTRAHQAAIFIAYESAIQMLCDSPSNYYKVPEFTSFIAEIPTTWDETIALEAKAGDYLLIARRKGEKWYISGLNDWTHRSLKISLDFLPAGDWSADIFRDGINTDTWAEDYVRESRIINSGDSLTIEMANGGGFAAILSK